MHDAPPGHDAHRPYTLVAELTYRCPLRCLWCHNPESQSPLPELMLHSNRCIACEACPQVCPQGAIQAQNRLSAAMRRGKSQPTSIWSERRSSEPRVQFDALPRRRCGTDLQSVDAVAADRAAQCLPGMRIEPPQFLHQLAMAAHLAQHLAGEQEALLVEKGRPLAHGAALASAQPDYRDEPK